MEIILGFCRGIKDRWGMRDSKVIWRIIRIADAKYDSYTYLFLYPTKALIWRSIGISRGG